MPTKLVSLILLTAVLTGLAVRCALSPLSGDGSGTASEVVAIQGFVRYPDGTPAAGITVYLRTSDAFASENDTVHPSLSTLTDELGWFRFLWRQTGEIILEAIDNGGNSDAIRSRIEPLSPDLTVEAVLKPSAMLAGQIQPLPSRIGQYVVIINGYRTVPVDSTGLFTIEIPAGSYSISFYDRLNQTGPGRMALDSVLPGEVRDLGLITISPSPGVVTGTATVKGVIVPASTPPNRYTIQTGTRSVAADSTGFFSMMVSCSTHSLLITGIVDSLPVRIIIEVTGLQPNEIRDIGTIQFPADTLIPSGRVVGQITPPPPNPRAYVVVADGAVQGFADSSGFFTLKLPTGTRRIRIFDRGNTARQVTIPIIDLLQDELRNLGVLFLEEHP